MKNRLLVCISVALSLNAAHASALETHDIADCVNQSVISLDDGSATADLVAIAVVSRCDSLIAAFIDQEFPFSGYTHRHNLIQRMKSRLIEGAMERVLSRRAAKYKGQ